MKLSRYGFDLLVLLEKLGPGKYTQKFLAEELSISVGLVNKLIRQFSDEGIICVENRITRLSDKGLRLLEPHRVKRAIILAAGLSERLAPVTLSVPKPLVTVKGKRIVDTLIDALLAAEIEDIRLPLPHGSARFANSSARARTSATLRTHLTRSSLL